MTEPASRDPLIGSRLDDRYVIERRLARGGMSTVYVAMDMKLRRQVAIKVLYPHLAEDPQFVDRFEAEAITAARLSHPHVVSVHDQGVDGETAYLVMEYVPGVTLRDVMREHSALSPRAALQVIDAVLAGLAAAHDAGLVHRDIKPENVLISPDGRIKVADFGLARAATSQTATSTLVGTVAYVSPELVTGTPADTRSDIYAVGVMLYEMLTGEQPFTGNSTWEIATARVTNAVPAPSEIVPELAADLDDLVRWSTEIDPEDRPHDAGSMLSELRHIRGELTPEELDLGRRPTPIGALLPALPAPGPTTPPSSSAAVPAPTSLPSEPDRGTPEVVSEAPTQVFGAAAPTAALPSAGWAAPTPRTEVLPGSASSPDDTWEFVTATDEDTAAGAPALAGPPLIPTLPSDTAPVDAGESDERVPSKREARNQAKAWKKEAQRPTESLARRGGARRGWIWAVVVVLLAAIIGTAGWFFGAGPGGKAIVPDVQGRSEAVAIELLSAQGFSVTTTDVFDESIAKGEVVGTDPPSGTDLRKMNPLQLQVSMGPELFAVPNLVGLDEKSATSKLQGQRLAKGKVTQAWDESVALGLVVKQGTKVDTEVRSGTKVDLVLSKGPSPVAVPDLSGRGKDDAKELLEARSLVSEQGDDIFSDTVPAGQVARQSVKAGDEVKKGTTVTWQLSKGPELFEVPKVTWKKPDEARQILKDAGFTNVREDISSLGVILNQVMSQSPKAGELVKPDTQITIGIG